MITQQQCADLSPQPYKTVQQRTFPLEAIPTNALFADVLKTLETQLQKRGLVESIRGGIFNPVWFLVETERNVFLWRHGHSLTEQDKFEFWVDIDALVEKRLRQLASRDAGNPFSNPSWGAEPVDGEQTFNQSLRDEAQYLTSFQHTLHRILIHAHALSQVGSMISKELCGQEKPRVLLPSTKER